MTEQPAEIEAKFEIGDADRERLAAVEAVGDFRVVSRTWLDQHDLYFDTTSGSLAAHGSTLRVRRNQKGAFMTFKGKRAEPVADAERHIASRLEDEVPLADGFVARVTDREPLPDDRSISPLRRARDLVGDDELRPTVVLRNQRLAIDLEHPDGQRAELSLDSCVATRLRDGRVVEFSEVELEATSADRVRLLELSRELAGVAPSLRPSHLTKLERALE